jgi:ketosteroid isomerase-like protein
MTRRKTTLAIALALALPAGRGHGAEGLAAEVEARERDLVSAIAVADLERYARLVADDYVATLPDGTELTKPQVMAAYRAGERGYRGLALHDVRVRVHGETAVVTARTSGFRTENGREVENRSLYVRVWVRRVGEWRAVAQLSTPLPVRPE